MEYNINNFAFSPELYHHGIKGQKWGKRNGPPYPLNDQSMSSSEINQNLKDRDNVRKRIELSEKGKRIAKTILMGFGSLAVGVAIASSLSSGSNYGLEYFNKEVFEKAVELSKNNSKIKTYLDDGRVLIPYKEYGLLVHNIMSGMTREMRNAKQFAFHFKGRVYICENIKNDIPRIVDWFELEDWENAVWEVFH